MTAKKIAFVTTFTPRRCGIATFASDLIFNLCSASQNTMSPVVFAMDCEPQLSYRDPVKFKIRRDLTHDYLAAADYVNYSSVDMICLQHEFGLFGGDAGSMIISMLERIRKPIVTTLHTVLQQPSKDQEYVLARICECSDKVIVMNARGVVMLRDIYSVPTSKIVFIPHGIPDLPFMPTLDFKRKLGLGGRRVILTFGLIGRNKGIETMLQALPEIVKADPDVLYVVLGATHPEVLRQEGRSYVDGLRALVSKLELEKHVVFLEKFVPAKKLYDYLLAADIYVTPYLHAEQLTSGTLAFAVGSGRAVVSTPYWAAQELLADGRGILTPFGSPQILAHEIVQIINEPSKAMRMRRSAYEFGRSMTWQKVGMQYCDLIAKQLNYAPTPRPAATTREVLTAVDPSKTTFQSA